jgi:hypothetical protein
MLKKAKRKLFSGQEGPIRPDVPERKDPGIYFQENRTPADFGPTQSSVLRPVVATPKEIAMLRANSKYIPRREMRESGVKCIGRKSEPRNKPLRRFSFTKFRAGTVAQIRNEARKQTVAVKGAMNNMTAPKIQITTMLDLLDWIQLREYLYLFEHEEIALEDVSTLTLDDIESMGIPPNAATRILGAFQMVGKGDAAQLQGHSCPHSATAEVSGTRSTAEILKGLKLESYLQLFENEELAPDDLPSLSVLNIEAMGIELDSAQILFSAFQVLGGRQ